MNQRVVCIIVLIVVVFSSLECDGKLPSNIQVCGRNDPNLAKCIINSVNHLQPQLVTGVIDANYKVPPLEPLKIDNIIIDRGPNFQVSIKNVEVRGSSSFIIEKMKVNLNELTFDFQLLLPKIQFKGKYSINLRIAFVPIVANNKPFIGLAEKFRARIKLTGKRYNGPDGRVYMRFVPFEIKIVPGAFDLTLTDLFANNPTFEAIGKAFVADNKQYFLNEVIPPLEKSLSSHFTNASNQIVGRTPLEELFP